MGKGIREFRASVTGDDDDDESPPKPAQIEGAEKPAEPVEGEVVTDQPQPEPCPRLRAGRSSTSS